MSNLKSFGKLISRVKALSKSALSVVLVLCLLVMMIPTVLLVAADGPWDGTIAGSYAGGDGTEDSPYQIATGAQLAYFAQQVNAGSNYANTYFKLTSDIDLGDVAWTPIGNTSSYVFRGIFDGDGHEISNLSINATASGAALFGHVGYGTVIKNLSLEGNVNTSAVYAAGFVGYVTAGNTLTMSNCVFTGTITSTSTNTEYISVGAFVGHNWNATIKLENCVAVNTTINASKRAVGGLVGIAISGTDVTIKNSSFSGAITGERGVGGLVGGVYYGNGSTNATTVTIENSYSEGSITATATSGGLVGFTHNQNHNNKPITITIKDSYSTMQLPQDKATAGLFGGNYAWEDFPSQITVNITDSFFAGKAKYPIMNSATSTKDSTPMTVTLSGVYYLEGAATTATPTIGNLSPAVTVQKTAAEFAGGAVRDLLNHGRNVWLQGATYPHFPKAPKMTNLEVDNGLLVFKENVTSYDLFLENSVTSLSVKPTVETGTAVTVNGATVQSGIATMVPLAANNTTVISVKIARDGTEKTYTLNVTCGPVWDGTTIATSFAGGDGTEGNPYQIATGAQLAYLAEQVNAGTNYGSTYFKLTSDINLGNKAWTPIGNTSSLVFRGILDGDGHQITNLSINATASGAGLFGHVGYGTVIKNLSLEGDIKTTATNAAGFVGYVTAGNTLTMSNCVFTGTITSTSTSENAGVAAFVGYNWNSTIKLENCVAVNTTITASKRAVGGLVAIAISGTDVTIKNSSFSGALTGERGVGGLVGGVHYGNDSNNATTVTIENSYSEGSITATATSGGLVGYTNNQSQNNKPITISIKDSYSTMQLAQDKATAGLFGGNYAWQDYPSKITVSITDSFFAGTAKFPIMNSAVDTSNNTDTTPMNVTLTNVYYLEGAATTATPTIGNLSPAVTVQKTASEFSDGTVVDLLNHGRNEWVQGTTYPVFPKAPKITNLEVDNGLFVFDKNVTSYDLFLENSVTSLSVKPTVETGTAVTVNGATVQSGDSVPVALAANAETVINVTIARDGTEKTYTINVFCGPVWDGTTIATSFAGGDGTEGNPYQIATGAQLAYLAEQVNAGTNYANTYFKLTSDINLANKAWTPIGNTSSLVFNGIFDGDGHQITNLFVNATTSGAGLFGHVGYGTVIKNLSLEGDIKTTATNAAGFVGYVTAGNTLTMSDCVFTGTITSTSTSENASVAAFVGYNWNSTIKLENCVAVNTTITASKRAVGGLVAIAISGTDLTIKNSSFSGALTGERGVGGLVGGVHYGNGSTNATTVTIENSYSEGSITATATSGGLIGYANNQSQNDKPITITITDSYSTMQLAQDKATAGLFGGNYAWQDYPSKITVSITDSFFAGTAKFPIMNSAVDTSNNTDTNPMNVTLTNVYYLEGSATTATPTIGNLSPAVTVQKTASEFSDGTVVDLLNNGRNVWGQGAAYPIFPKHPKMTNLEVDNGHLVFDENVTDYDLFFENSVTSLSVKPTVEEGTVVTVNGATIQSGDSVPVALVADGAVIIKVKIAREGIEKTYTINVFCGPVWDGTTIATSFAGGNGSENDPYQIETGAQLAYFAQQVNAGTNYADKYLKLTSDINLGDNAWTPIGNSAANAFKGTLDGDGYAISNLYINSTEGNVGLFGFAAGTIKNLSLEGKVKSAKANVAGFVGYVPVDGKMIFNSCVFTGAVSSTSTSGDNVNVGSFVGNNWNSSIVIENCAAVDTTITTEKPGSTGGLVGIAIAGTDLTIKGSSFSGTINGGQGTGGLVGGVYYGNNSTDHTKVNIENSYSEGTITSTTNQIVGGLVGFLRVDQTANESKKIEVSIKDSYSVATLITDGTSGGLVGQNYGWQDYPGNIKVDIKDSFFAGSAKYPILNATTANAAVETPMTVTLNNVYYQTGSATTDSDLTPAATCEKSVEAFSDGTVVDLLNNGRNVWGQGVAYPIFPKAPLMTNLEVDNGLLEFNENDTDYDIYFENSVTSLSVKPTVEDGTSVTVNGATIQSGDSVPVALAANGSTVIKVTIAREGVEKTYTINVFCGPLWDGVTATPYPNADEADAGTKENPYQIALPEHLAYMAQQINLGIGQTAHYEMVANIILDNELWTPIGKVVDGLDRPFSGTFNGNGYTIAGLNYFFDVTTDADEDGTPDEVDTYNATSAPSRSSGGVGLFGIVKDATIKNLNVRGSVVTDQHTVGGLIGRAPGAVTIKNCHFNGKVKAGTQNYLTFAGGLIGSVSGDATVTIIDSSVTGSVEGDATKYYTYTSEEDTTLKLNTQSPEYVGGLIGYLAKATVYIADSHVNADVITARATAVGGMIGGIDANSDGGFTNVSLERCYSTGSVAGNRIGGLIGWLRDDAATANGKGVKLTMKNCYSEAELISSSAATGGLVSGTRFGGSAEDIVIQIENCFYAGSNAGVPLVYHNPAGGQYDLSQWDIDVTTAGYTPLSYANNLYYLAGSYNSVANDISNGMAGAEKSRNDMRSAAFVAQLNANAGDTVWVLGTDHPELLSFPKLDGIELNHGTIEFSPIVYDYKVYVSNKYDSITVTPTTEDSSVTIKVNGNDIVSGDASAAISLSEDAVTDIKVQVTLGDATTTYTIHAMLTEAWDGTYEPLDTRNNKGASMDDPILISTPGQLAFLSAMANGVDVTINGKLYPAPRAVSGKVYNGVYFEITADLLMNVIDDYANWDTDAPANDFEPIGHHSDTLSESRTFAGIVNGNQHKIIGLYVRGTSYGGVAGVGLFGSVDGGILRNIHIEKGYVTGAQRVAGLVGRPRTSITVQNCSFSGTVRGTFIHADHDTLAGGLIGDTVARTVLNSCWTEGIVSGGHGTGGLIGQIYMQTGVEIKNCYSTMTIEVPEGYTAGGLIGVLSGKAGTVDVYRTHFAGHVPTNTPFIGRKSENSAASVTSSDTFYYREGSYEGEIDNVLTYDAVEKSAKEFADGTLTDLLNSQVEYGDYWNWETDENGYPVSDGVLLVTDYRDHTSDKFYDDGDWYLIFTNAPGGTLKPHKKPDNNQGEDGPVVDDPIVDDPVEDEPIEDEPIEDEPIEDEPVEDEPVEDEPVEDEPIEDEPIEDEPVEDEPVDDDFADDDNTDDDYINSPTGEKSLYSAVLILALISAISAFFLARRKRSVN